ncbi:MAG: hypothetical protein GY913_33615, partial [Proteobacteria bacterium]|nr:hypothetical protein [Pseudomonadota bacterium]
MTLLLLACVSTDPSVVGSTESELEDGDVEAPGEQSEEPTEADDGDSGD